MRTILLLSTFLMTFLSLSLNAGDEWITEQVPSDAADISVKDLKAVLSSGKFEMMDSLSTSKCDLSIKVDSGSFEVSLYAKPGKGMNYQAKKSFVVSFSKDERVSGKTIEEKYKSGKIKGQRVVFYKTKGDDGKASSILSMFLTEDKSSIKEVVIVDFSQVGINRVKPCWHNKPVKLSKRLEL